MNLTDTEISFFDRKVLKLLPDRRKEFLKQADYLISQLQSKIDSDTSFAVTGFTKTGSLMKGTVLRPRDGKRVDADIAVYLDLSEADRDDVDLLHEKIRELLIAVYPTKDPDDFKVQPYTLGIEFHDSGLAVDLVPIIPIEDEPGFGWQPSSAGAMSIRTSVSGQLMFIRDRRDGDRRYRGLVRLGKRWRNHQELDQLRSFAIELIMAHLYDTHGLALSLEDGLLRFFLFIAKGGLRSPICFPEQGTVNRFPADPVVILDPVNAENNVTKRITTQERTELEDHATIAWETISTARRNGYRGETIELWMSVFGRSFVVED